jgi:hypothetical protein
MVDHDDSVNDRSHAETKLNVCTTKTKQLWFNVRELVCVDEGLFFFFSNGPFFFLTPSLII